MTPLVGGGLKFEWRVSMQEHYIKMSNLISKCTINQNILRFCSTENWISLKFPWTRNLLLIVSWKLVRNSRTWSRMRWLIMVWIEYSSPWFTLSHSGQRTSVKCAEAAWNYKSRGVVHLKSPAFFLSQSGKKQNPYLLTLVGYNSQTWKVYAMTYCSITLTLHFEVSSFRLSAALQVCPWNRSVVYKCYCSPLNLSSKTTRREMYFSNIFAWNINHKSDFWLESLYYYNHFGLVMFVVLKLLYGLIDKCCFAFRIKFEESLSNI